METEIKLYSLDTLNNEVIELYDKKKRQEDIIRDYQMNERFEQFGYDDSEEECQPPISEMELMEKELYDISLSLEKKEDIIKKIEQCEEYKSLYPNGYKRKMRKQTNVDVEDKLSRRNKAKDVAKTISDKKVKTVGIFGEWGTGKTTFLEYVKDELSGKNLKIIDIKATEYSDQEKIWTYFFSKMRESVKSDYNLRLKYFLKRIGKDIKHYFAGIINIVLIIVLIVLLFKFDLFNIFSKIMGIDDDTAKVFATGMNWFVSILFVVKWVIPLVGQIMETVNAAICDFSEIAKRDVNEKLGYKIVVKEYISEMLSIWKKCRFVFFVDELDRCNKYSIMSFLEAVQLLEEYESIQIIYAIDTEVVLNAIEESGIHKSHNYLKKYVDLKINLEPLNTQKTYIEAIAKDDYDFTKKEIEKIQLAMENLEINISVRDYIHILNSLSELKERWIIEEVLSAKCKNPKYSEDVLNWYNSIPVAILFFAGSLWPSKIYKDFRIHQHAYIKVYYIARNAKIEQQYIDCPAFLKQTNIIDVLNVMNLVKDMPPIYVEKL